MEAADRDLVVSIVREHADSLLRTARRYTACAADAEDAYQRALEVFVKSAHRLDPEAAHRWLHVVVRNEALAVRRARSSLVGVEDEAALDALDDGRHLASVEERSERLDDLGRAAEALQGLKPQEVTALWLKAQGLSYREIADRQGWTYTKVNRAITEGRRAFLRRYAGIEAGEECERWSPALAAIADGEATPRQLLEARPHLRNCPSCRASVAAMRRGKAAVVALLPPVAAEAAGGRFGELWAAAHERGASVAASLHDRAAGAAASIHDRAAGAAASIHDRAAGAAASLHGRAVAATMKLQAAAGAIPSGRAAAVAVSAAALAGGGAVAERGLGGGDARAAAAGPADVVAPAPLAPPRPSGRDRPRWGAPAGAGARLDAPPSPAASGVGADDWRAGASAPGRAVRAGSDVLGGDAGAAGGTGAPSGAVGGGGSGAGGDAGAAGESAAPPGAPGAGRSGAGPRERPAAESPSRGDRMRGAGEAGEFGLVPAPPRTKGGQRSP